MPVPIQREGRLLLDGRLVPGRLELVGGRIERVERLVSETPGPILAPGLIDLHVHGYGGCEPLSDLAGLARALARVGTTAFLPTLFPDEPVRLGQAAAGVVERARDLDPGTAGVLGTHLEGPFVNPRRVGALPADRLIAPSPQALRALLGPASGEGRGIRQMTVAPELAGGLELAEELARLGVRVSLGHSEATALEAARATEHGARGATHLFNAMSGVHHREAGLASYVLAEEQLVSEIIGDLVHVGPTALRLALRARGAGGLALVSDALRESGTGRDRFDSHGKRCRVQDGAIWFEDAEGGIAGLTGADASQLEAVRRLVRAGVTDVATALTMAAETPARALGLEDERGRFVPGARADWIALDDDLRLLEVGIGGSVVQLAELGE
jgi:N-acetylglucosamine-6-phosphate deacetylase